jgi:hypothetical protein
MNSLSWLIYLAKVSGDLSSTVQTFLTINGVVLVVGLVIGLLVFAIIADSYGLSAFDNHNEEFVFIQDWFKKYKKFMKTLMVTFPIFMIIGSILPDKKTVLLIAASQISEEIINNPKVQGIIDPSIDLLKSWIKLQNIELEKTIDNKTIDDKTNVDHKK